MANFISRLFLGVLLWHHSWELICIPHMPKAWWLIRWNLFIIISFFRLHLHIASCIKCRTTKITCDLLPVRTRVLGLMFFMEWTKLRICTLFKLEHRLLCSFGSNLVAAWSASYLSLLRRMTSCKCVHFTLFEFRHFSGQALDKANEGLNIGCFLVFTLACNCLGIPYCILGVLC